MPATRVETCYQSMLNTLVNIKPFKFYFINFAIALFACLLSGCGLEKYFPKPINSQATTAKIIAKTPTSANFKSYLIKQGYKEVDLPFASWGLDELTLNALYFHPNLTVAKAQIALAQAELETAGLRTNPTLNVNSANNSRANSALSPWAFGFNIEIPIITNNKREISIDKAKQLVEAARLTVADTAWQLRHQIAIDLLLYQQNLAQTSLLQNELTIQDDLLSRLKKRVDIGLQSNTELLDATILQQKTVFALQNVQTKQEELIAILAADAGLTLPEFKKIKLQIPDINETINQQIIKITALNTINIANTASPLQEKALLNRIAIRKSLANYAAAEAAVQLEVAKQIPDFSISPGYAFELGDKVWSLGFSSLLNLLKNNPTLINQAIKLRDIEGAQFELLQHTVIAEVTTVQAQYQANQNRLKEAEKQLNLQQTFLQKLQKQLDAGLIDKVVFVQSKLNQQLALQQIQNAQFDLLNSAILLENVMQYPLFTDFKMP